MACAQENSGENVIGCRRHRLGTKIAAGIVDDRGKVCPEWMHDEARALTQRGLEMIRLLRESAQNLWSGNFGIGIVLRRGWVYPFSGAEIRRVDFLSGVERM